MSREPYTCDCCGTKLRGDAQFCVYCWPHCHMLCGECSYIDWNGVHRLKKGHGKGSSLKCNKCANVRYVCRPRRDWPCLQKRKGASTELAPFDPRSHSRSPTIREPGVEPPPE